MRPLIGKLDMLLLDPPPGCSSTEAMDGTRLLRDEVEKISSYLDDLSELTDPPLKAMCWMNEVRDLSYDMEDYINSLIFVPNNNKTIRTLRELSTHVQPPRTQVIIAETLLEFRMYVQETIERHHRYNLLYCRTLRHRFVSMGPMLLPTAHVVTDDIVIDGRMNEFINSLANDRDQQLKVSCLLGSACLGKTTLAEVLYNKFGKNYSCRAFVRVSKKPDMKRAFHDMLWQIQRQRPSRHCKEVELIDKIKKYLQDKRYLIVIDDVWAASVWDIINHACPKGNHGSRLITTTQVEGVALKCCCYQPEYVLEMKHLDDDHSRKLFFNRLFGSESYCPEEFKEVLNDIVEVCDGLPLAIISIASVLASQPAMPTDLLKYIHQSLNSCFSASERMRQALNLSFNNLPHYLTTCLLYLVMYPEGYIF
uniref:NB-ARC domain-containing protein n=2 Tax=Aegilops tauschii subsp. strangulata TaxID=200361 RepID=A0A453QA25_AEGTS